MNRKNWFFKQKVKETELDAAFDDVENALHDFLKGFDYVGIAAGAVVTQNSPTNLTVVASGPATVYDQNQNHVQWFPNQVVNCALDEDGAATTVVGVGNERYLSIFAEFDEVLSDPRVDGNGDTVYFSRTESFKINVVQGAEAPVGTATKPPLRGDQILLADVKLVHGQTTILNANIAVTRTQIIYDLSGSPLAIKERGLQAVLQAMVDQINAFDASSVDVPAIVDSPLSLPEQSITADVTDLLAAVNENTTTLAKLNNFAVHLVSGAPGLAESTPATILNYASGALGAFTISGTNIRVPSAGFYRFTYDIVVQLNSVLDDTAGFPVVHLRKAGANIGVVGAQGVGGGCNGWHSNDVTAKDYLFKQVGYVVIADPAVDLLDMVFDVVGAVKTASSFAGTITLERLSYEP